MATTIFTSCDEEVQRRRRAELRKKFGGTEGRIAEVSMGTRIVKVPSPRPPFAAGPEGSYMARKLAESCRSPATFCDETPPAPEKAMLLDKIHSSYLTALAMMGTEAVRRHARGMVFAGYTYGLLSDPVANIVANAIWYDRTFPPSSSIEEADAQGVKLLSAKAVFRMACRSLDTLVAFMKHFTRGLPTRDIYACLASVNGNLQAAVALLHRSGYYDQQGGFMAAVRASDLPSVAAREAHLSFVTNYDSVRRVLLDYISRLEFCPSIYGFLRPPQVRCEPYVGVCAMSESPGALASCPPNLSPSAFRALRLKIHSFKMEEKRSLEVANLALQKLSFQLGEPYELHIVCGMSHVIVPPNVYYHINFLAYPEGSLKPPTHFFAEVNAGCNHVNDVTLCCPLTEEKGRCDGCDAKGVKLIHPANVSFNGAADRTGDVSLTDPTSDFHAPLNEDYIFYKFNHHPWTSAFLEASYAHMSDDQVNYSFCWFENYLP